MEIQVSDVQQKQRSWVWGTLFVAMGLFNVIDFFYQGRTAIHSLLTGVGFLLFTPKAFLHPLHFTKPLRPQLIPSPVTSKPIAWLSIVGTVLILLV